LNQIHVGADTGGDFSRSQKVEESDVLPENGLEVELSNLFGDLLPGVGKPDDTDVSCDKRTDG
jgi:hypothetical protein